MISVIILTHNDDVQIGACLESVARLSDDVVVVDSFSNDRTAAICIAHGAQFVQHEFVNQVAQEGRRLPD